jgi:CubicO group peptidase (beta-lactamase class C family)
MTERPTDLSPESVRQAVDYAAGYLEFQQRFRRVPGVQAAVLHRDELVLSEAWGHSDLESGAPLTTGHLFRIASHSKTFTATAVLQLVAAGRLRLDDPAGMHVTALSDAGSPLARVTVRELLSHAAGITRDSSDGDFWQLMQPFPDHDRLLAILTAADAAVLAANERFKYSNIGYGLLGLIIEAVTGRSYAAHVQQAIVDPLGLSDLGPELDPGRASDYATGYSSHAYADRRVAIDHVHTAALASATGFYATAQDLVRYFAAHFTGDDRLLSDEGKRLMRQALWETGGSKDRRYGLGLSISPVGERRMIGHGGGYPGHITASLVDPDARLAVSVLTNAIDGPADPLARAVVRLIDLAVDGPGADGTELARFTGRFAGLWGVTDVALLGGRLYLLDPTQADPTEDPVPLDVIGDDALKIAGGPGYGTYGESVRYRFAADGSIASIRADSGATLVPLDDWTLPQRFTVRPAATATP